MRAVAAASLALALGGCMASLTGQETLEQLRAVADATETRLDCMHGSTTACEWVVAYWRGQRTAYEDDCAKGDAGACISLSEIHMGSQQFMAGGPAYLGEEFPPSNERIFEFRRKACAFGSSSACYFAFNMMGEWGQVPLDGDLAVVLWTKGCQLNGGDDCQARAADAAREAREDELDGFASAKARGHYHPDLYYEMQDDSDGFHRERIVQDQALVGEALGAAAAGISAGIAVNSAITRDLAQTKASIGALLEQRSAALPPVAAGSPSAPPPTSAQSAGVEAGQPTPTGNDGAAVQGELRACVGAVVPMQAGAVTVIWTEARQLFQGSLTKLRQCWGAAGHKDTDITCGRKVRGDDGGEWSRIHQEVTRLRRYRDSAPNEVRLACGKLSGTDWGTDWQVEFWCDNLSRDCERDLSSWLRLFDAFAEAEPCLVQGTYRTNQLSQCKSRVVECERRVGRRLQDDPCQKL